MREIVKKLISYNHMLNQGKKISGHTFDKTSPASAVYALGWEPMSQPVGGYYRQGMARVDMDLIGMVYHDYQWDDELEEWVQLPDVTVRFTRQEIWALKLAGVYDSWAKERFSHTSLAQQQVKKRRK